MIQEKDFLYRVPVKTAPITTPRGQIRNPEILVDLEGGEFMYGNILDANSTNKLINQSVKDGDEDLSAKIKAEQTRAEGKEKEISDKLAIVDGDSNTEGSFRKAIADVVGAAPEAYDTLKEIADKLSQNDDLHTAINEAIATKATTVALNEEITRAKAAEAENKAEIAAEAARAKQAEAAITSDVIEKLAQKADTNTLANYALKTELPTVPTKVSELQNDSEFIVKSVYDEKIAALEARIAALEAKHPEAAE